jgi:hypothetical protein
MTPMAWEANHVTWKPKSNDLPTPVLQQTCQLDGAGHDNIDTVDLITLAEDMFPTRRSDRPQVRYRLSSLLVKSLVFVFV